LYLLRTEKDVLPYDYRCRLEWHRLSVSLDSASLIAAIEDDLGGCTAIAAVDDYVVVALNTYGEEGAKLHPRVEVFRADDSEGLVRVFRHRFPRDELLYDIAVDAERGLLFAGTTGAVYSLDLGIATTGEAAWP
jgi:hypothetical protein